MNKIDIIIISLIIGFAIGCFMTALISLNARTSNDKLIENNLAYYDSKTGEFKLIKLKQENE